MGLHTINTDKAPAAIGPYSQAINAGPWLFVSGQIPLRPSSGEMAGDDFTTQSRQALDNLKSILDAAGYRLADVVSVDVFLTDISSFSSFNSIYSEYFSDHKPARAVVEVKGLPRGALLELKCIAYKNE